MEDGGAPRDDAPSAGEERWARLAGHRAAPALLFLSAVIEGCLFPAPTEALYAALALARPRRSWRLAAVAAAGSVLGGAIAWTLGAWFMDGAGQRLLDSPGLGPSVSRLMAAYERNAALALVTSGYTPVPYVAYGLTAGAAGIPLATFVAFSAVGRGLKYAILAGIARVAAPVVRRWMDRSTIAVILVFLLIAGLIVFALRW